MAGRSQLPEGIDANELYTRAAVAEHARDFDTAFKLYLSAAQAHLHHARIIPAQHTAERAKCKVDAGVCLSRAEQIKAARKDTLRPVVQDPFSKEEQTYILDKSSNVNGSFHPVWEASGSSIPDGDARMRSSPALGSELLSISPEWHRSRDIYKSKMLTIAGPSLQPHHIHQNIVTDCSVCSASAICLNHHRMFGSKLGLSCVFPQDSNGLPIISSDGVYDFRLFINGSFRKASFTIDDMLPFTTEGRLLSVTAMAEDGSVDIWPALIEKAYMKLMGGYDFPGSNSSVDVHALTGWIPEHVEIHSPTFVREKVWRRISTGFRRGICVLTVGTGARAPIDRDGNKDILSVSARDGSLTRLLATHSYAILGMHEDGGDQWVTIANPWNVSLMESVDNGNEGKISERLDELQIDELDVSEGNDVTLESLDNGRDNDLIDVSWDDVCAAFDGLYLNWDPSEFKSSALFHGEWRSKTNARREPSTSQCMHQYLTLDLSSPSSPSQKRNTFDTESELWVLLYRHVVDKSRTGEFIAVHTVLLETGLGVDEHVQEAGFVDSDMDLKGTYTNSTHALTRLAVPATPARIALVASYDGPYTNVCFSVQAFMLGKSREISWVAQPQESMYERVIEGTFSARTSGGNSTYSTFMNNPQYMFRLHPQTRAQGEMIGNAKAKKAQVRLMVEGPRNVPLNTMLMWRDEGVSNERVIQLGPGDAIVNSGTYSYGVAQAAASVLPGDYCIIVSTFEPRHRGSFTLRVQSDSRMDISEIPAEGAGLFCKTVKGIWQSGTDGGSPRFGDYSKNPMFQIEVKTATALKLRLQLVKPSASIALNVTLFASTTSITPRHSTSSASTSSNSIPSSSASSHRSLLSTSGSYTHSSIAPSLTRQIVTSGAYADGSSSPAGVVTPQTPIAPGNYIAVVSTFDPGQHAAFQLLVFTKTDVRVTAIKNS